MPITRQTILKKINQINDNKNLPAYFNSPAKVRSKFRFIWAFVGCYPVETTSDFVISDYLTREEFQFIHDLHKKMFGEKE